MIFSLIALLAASQVTIPPPPSTAGKPFYRAQHSPSCEVRLRARAGKLNDPELLLASERMWVRGYISGFNVHGPDLSGDILGSTPMEEVDAFLDAHCKRYPTDLLADAMPALTTSLLKRRPPGPVETGRRKAQIAWTITCDKWIESHDNRIVRLAYETAMGGYVTAYNLYGPDPVGDLIGTEDDAFVGEWIDGWCRDNRGMLAFYAVYPLAKHLAAERAAGRLPPGGRRPKDRLSPGAERNR